VTGEGRRQAAREELGLAAEELKAADALLDAELPRVAVTRAYFAVFHAMRARLYAEGLEPRSHLGAQHLFNLHFVKSGRYDAETSRLLARLQKFREEADYAQAFVIDDRGAREEVGAARRLVDRIVRDMDKPVGG
jgi:uncharacterized protein (UPF0332 family)